MPSIYELSNLYKGLRDSYENGICNEWEVGSSFRSIINEIVGQEIDSKIQLQQGDQILKVANEIADRATERVTQRYEQKIQKMEKILQEQLKLFGAVALVSNDPEIRESAEQLLKDNKINIYQLLKDSK